MQNKILILCLFLSCLACKEAPEVAEKNRRDTTEIKFDKAKWQIADGDSYAYRKQMLKDLVANLIATKKSRPLPKQEVLDMLGEPNRVDTLYLFYEVRLEHLGFLPYNAVTLVIKLKEDETVDKVLIAE